MQSIIIQVLRYLVSVCVLLLTWELVVRLFSIPAYVLPSPITVFHTLGAEFAWFATHAIATIANVAAGGAIGILCGFAVGVALAYSRWTRWIAEPYLIIFQSFPREALIPLFVVWLGFGATPKIVNSALLSFFPMAVITMNSLMDTRSEYLELVRNWGASKFQQFLHCRVPAGAYAIAGGLKIAAPLAIIGAVLGEFLGGNVGLGYVIVSSGASFRLDRSFAAIVILAVVGMLTLAAVKFIQDVLLKRFKQE